MLINCGTIFFFLTKSKSHPVESHNIHLRKPSISTDTHSCVLIIHTSSLLMLTGCKGQVLKKSDLISVWNTEWEQDKGRERKAKGRHGEQSISQRLPSIASDLFHTPQLWALLIREMPLHNWNWDNDTPLHFCRLQNYADCSSGTQRMKPRAIRQKGRLC